MRTGPVLVSDLLDKYQPLGAFGQPVYMSYVQLRATITQKLGARHANYFAKPDRDPQNKSIHWISEVAGTARRWVDLSPEEQTRHALDLQALRSDFIRYLDELHRQGEDASKIKMADGKGAAAFASLLEEAMLVPDDSHLYFVGDQPVVSFWGFRTFGGQAVDALRLAPRRPAPAAAVAPAQEGVALPFERPRRSWWRWLLWALGLLLLLLLLLLGLYTCLPAQDRAVLFGDLGEEPRQSGQQVLQHDGFVNRALRYFGFGSSVTDGGVPAPGGEAQTGPDAGVSVPPATEQPVPDGSAPSPDESREQKAGDQPSSKPPQPPDQTSAKEDQTTPEPPKPQPQPQQDQEQPKRPQPDQGGAQQGANDRSLQIPPDAAKTGNTGFVGGEWRSDKGLIDQVTKQPLQQAYRFDQQGNGEVVIRRPDGVECRAAAQARMQGGQLSINELADPQCPDGRTFRRSKTECMRTPSGQTVCQGRNADGSTYRVGIERQQAKP
jgi:outer membrane biosynthesis protein TonB